MGVFPLFLLLLLGAYQVKGFQVNGVHWTSKEYVISRAGFRKGLISDQDIAQGIKRLYKDGFFKDIKVYVSQESDSLYDLIISVEENQRIDNFTIEGLKHIKKKKIIDTLGIKKGMYVSSDKIFTWARAIEKLLKEKGYLAKVSVSTDTTKEGFVDLHFTVNEGPVVKIKSIKIDGNTHFSDKILKSLLRNKEKRWYRKGKFKDEYWYADLVKIEKFYHDHGFPWATVDSSTKKITDGEISLKIFVTENNEIRFGKINFSGNRVFKEDLLSKEARLIPKKPSLKDRYNKILKGIPWDPTIYCEERLQKAVTAIAGIYADSGYLYVQVVPEKDFEGDSIVNVTFKIKENFRTRVRLVDIRGNKKTHDPVIRRELVLFPGEYFSKSKLIQSERNLFFLNYFSNVSADFKDTPDTTQIDLVFKIDEKQAGSMGLGATYSLYEGPGIYFQVQQPNLLGRGQSIAAMVQYSSKARNYRLSFTEPWFKGRPISLGFDLHDNMMYYPEFKEWRQGGSVSYSRMLWNRYSHIAFTYTLERQRLYDLAMPEKYMNYQMVPALASLSTHFWWDVRDRSFNATRGRRISYELEVSGGPFGGEYFPLSLFVVLTAPYSYSLSQELAQGAADFHSHIFEGIQYFHLSNKFVAVSRVKSGFVSGFKEYNRVPLTRLFWLGDIGPFGLRGYSFASVGPGRLFTILSQEFRYRPSETFYVDIFADAGQTWKSWPESNFSKPWLRSFRRSIGLGFRVEVPMMGVLGIDFAYGLDNPTGAHWQTHFQFGPIGNY